MKATPPPSPSTVSTLPSIVSLQCFVEAARRGSFREAARAMALTPAALGQRIKALESELGVPLFVRTSRTIALTMAGLRVLPAAEAALDATRGTVSAALGVGVRTFNVTLGTRHELGMSWIFPQLEGLRTSLPVMQIHLYFGSGTDLFIRLRTGEIDVGVSSMSTSDPKVASLLLHREDYVLCASPALLARTPFRRIEDAPSHVFIDEGHELPLFNYFRHSFGDHEPRFKRLLRLGCIEAIRAGARAGVGITSLPEYYVRDDIARGDLVRLLPTTERGHDYFRLFFRADDPRRSVWASLAEQLRACPLR